MMLTPIVWLYRHVRRIRFIVSSGIDITAQVDAWYVDAAWVFVVFRTLHSIVHGTFNRVMLRFYLNLFSSLALGFIAIRAMLHYLGSRQ